MRKFLLLVISSFISFSLQSQVIKSFLEKYGKEEGLEIVSIGKKMLNLMQCDSIASRELKEAIAGLENIKIVSSDDEVMNKYYYHSAYELISKDEKYTEVLSVNQPDELLYILVKKTKEKKVDELIFLSSDNKNFYLISLTGDIQLDILIKYSGSTGVKELGKLNNIQ